MKSLTDVYEQLSGQDAELEKQAAEMFKQAEEEDAAGRIMARGFADELHKLAEGPGGMNIGPAGGGLSQRRPKAPKAPKLGPANFGSDKQVKGTTGEVVNKPKMPKPPKVTAQAPAAKPF